MGVSNPKHPEMSDSKHPDVSDSALPEVSDPKPETYNNKKTRRKNPRRKTTNKNDLYVSTTPSTRTNPSKVGVSPSTSSHSDSPPADTPTLDEEAFQKIRRHLAENYHLDKGAWSLIVQEILNRKEGPKQLQKCVEDMELRNQVGDRLSNPVGWLISHVKNRYNVGWLYEHKKKIDKAKRYKAGNKISREDIEKTKRELAKYR
ncbi:MAG: hypothetical protein JW701_08535 [Kosmotogaceae bacterium]|nr:hypothetical protein [Kosmotogaceae bacterium]